MADSISSLSDLADRATLVNNQDTVDADEHNTTRTATQNAVNLLIDVVQEQDDNYAGTTEPTLKSEGKTFCDTTNDPAVMKYYKDGSANSEELVGTTLTQTLTNKTLTNPIFSPAGAKAYLGLGRDRNLKITNNSTNPNYQIDITFDYLTLYDTNGRGAVESQTSVLTLDVQTGTGAGGRAASENSGAEQASVWYYIYVYSDGAGTINGLLAQASTWEDVVTNTDNPSGSDYVRRVGAIRNNGSSNFVKFNQAEGLVSFETGGTANVGSFGAHTITARDVSSLVPVTAIEIIGYQRDTSSNCAVLSTDQVNNISGVGSFFSGGSNDFSKWSVPVETTQTIYTYANGGTHTVSVVQYRVSL